MVSATRPTDFSDAPDAFICPTCKVRYGDPLYHGPSGHAPEGMCFDCWASEWASMVQLASRGGNWRPIDSALYLLCQGFTHKQAADLAGVCRRTLDNWIRDARRKPHLAPQWLVDRAAARRTVRL